MSVLELQKYYSDLLILQYKDKPRARDTIRELVGQLIADELPLQLQDAWNLDNATGAQLNVLGKYIGVTRFVYDFSGPVTLSDADFRTLIRIKIIQNNGGSSLADIQDLLFTYFSGAIFVYDYQDMTMSYVFGAAIGSQQLAEVFVVGGFLPKPMGVGLRATIYNPNDLIFFGMRTYLSPAFEANPFNEYADYKTDWPWLTYEYALVF